MAPVAIKVENVSKKYNLRGGMEGSTISLKEVLNAPFNKLLGRNGHHAAEPFYALHDVSFEIKHGESVGLIGRNGAGKSTLLKILSRITRPSAGRVTLYEHVNSLLEIGTGFNTELSGQENIYLNGSFLGMKVREIRAKYDEIVAFSEIGDFINTPVKYYSSGMFVRLAFSVAVHLTPEALLLDEILAVGDAGFRKKSTEKMKELLGSGATIVLVSHSEDSIKEVCQRIIWLDKGRVKMDGPADVVMKSYLEFINSAK